MKYIDFEAKLGFIRNQIISNIESLFKDSIDIEEDSGLFIQTNEEVAEVSRIEKIGDQMQVHYTSEYGDDKWDIKDCSTDDLVTIYDYLYELNESI